MNETASGSASIDLARVLGTWRMVESRAHDGNGKTLPPSYGPNFLGLVMFDAGGRMMCVLSDGRLELPGSDDRREYTSYGGAWRVSGSTLTTRVDISSDAHRIGGDEVRQVRFEGDRLVLTPPPRDQRGITQHRELVWEKLAAARS
jgi:hypothetical protein